MKITSAEFILSGMNIMHLPTTNYKEIMMCGRSNVGKSSFINMILGRKNIARTSAEPGKTRHLNFYLVNESFYLVDVPGYGYARVSKKMKEEFGAMIEEYITRRHTLVFAFLLVDFRHAPTEDDVLMYNFLKHYHIPVCVIATKKDKVKKSEYSKNTKIICDKLKIEATKDLIITSSETKEGREEVYQKIAEIIQ